MVCFLLKYRTNSFHAVSTFPYGERDIFSIRLTVRIIPTHEKYRLSRVNLLAKLYGRYQHGAGDLRNIQIPLSRPIIGHTPRKLPPCGAISRFIAVSRWAYFSRADFSILKEMFPNVKRIFSLFYEKFQNFLGVLPISRRNRFRPGYRGSSGRKVVPFP